MKKTIHRTEQKDFARSVIFRDNSTCAICRKRNLNSAAHHVKVYSKNAESRSDPDNGITLCQKHHNLVHQVTDQELHVESFVITKDVMDLLNTKSEYEWRLLADVALRICFGLVEKESISNITKALFGNNVRDVEDYSI